MSKIKGGGSGGGGGPGGIRLLRGKRLQHTPPKKVGNPVIQKRSTAPRYPEGEVGKDKPSPCIRGAEKMSLSVMTSI